MYSSGSVFDARPIALILPPLAGLDLTRSPEGCIHCCKHSIIALGANHTAPLSLHELPVWLHVFFLVKHSHLPYLYFRSLTR